jgi:hypothetical protein
MAKTLFKPVSYELSQLLGDIDLGKLALPELQRPFVWKKAAVRDLLDSMYRGFPVGYLMLWNAAEVDSKLIGVDGKQHTPTEFIVDGQQRLTGLFAVMKGAEITFKDFSKGRISIAFRPRDGQFDVTDAAIEKDPEFLPNVTQLWTGEDWEVIESFVERLRTSKPEALEEGREKQLRTALGRLSGLEDFPFLAVQIGHEVDEERVAEIFLRVNSGGTMLTQADFILTLLSVFREEDRRRLEHFAQAVRIVPADATPSPYNHLVKPAADQLLRVAVLVAFQRGRLQSVLALLRGGSLDGDATLVEGDREAQLDKLTAAIDVILDLTSWHEYIKTLMSAGFRRSNEISSENNVVLVYALYLIGRGYGLSHSDLRTTIARYFFMSSLTGRYTGSFEAQITQDVQAFTQATNGPDYLGRLPQRPGRPGHVQHQPDRKSVLRGVAREHRDLRYTAFDLLAALFRSVLIRRSVPPRAAQRLGAHGLRRVSPRTPQAHSASHPERLRGDRRSTDRGRASGWPGAPARRHRRHISTSRPAVLERPRNSQGRATTAGKRPLVRAAHGPQGPGNPRRRAVRRSARRASTPLGTGEPIGQDQESVRAFLNRAREAGRRLPMAGAPGR